jgi:type IV fimbrial biogenesis protein FimT
MTVFATARRLLGFTLVEILVVIAMIAILMSLAAPSMNAVRINSAVSEAASDLSIAVQQAQLQALKVNRQLVVSPPTVSDWAAGWKVFIKQDTNNLYDDGVDTLISTREAVPTSVSVASTSTCSNIIIEATGFAKGDANCRVVFGSTTTSRYKHVIIAKYGRARICTSNSPTVASCAD